MTLHSDDPTRLYIVAYRGDMITRYEVLPPGRTDGTPWVPESDLDDLRELLRRAYHAMRPDRSDGPVSRRFAQITFRKLEAEVKKHFPGEVGPIGKDMMP